MIRKILLPILFFMAVSSAFAQQKIKSFSEDAAKFPQELKSFMGEGNIEESKEILKVFIELWQTKRIPADQQEAIYRTTNKMLSKRMKPFPDFHNYLKAVVSVTNSKQAAASFDAWQEGLDRLLDGPNKNFTSFINTCNELFSNSYVYHSTTTVWFANTDSYTFAYDSLPKIIFPNMDLICRSKGDSAIIFNTQGVYYPKTNKWYGKGGKVTWARAGIGEDTVWAELKKYKIDMVGSDYDADSVQFYHKGFFDKPLLGRLTDKLLANVTEEKATYPRFTSYNTNIELKNIAPEVNYRGGFSQHGAKFIGSGTRSNPAKLVFYRGNVPFIVCSSQGFTMKPKRFSSENAYFKMYMGKGNTDSIIHPGVTVKFLKEKREFSAIRSEVGIGKSPFYDSFHQLELFVEQMVWNMNDTAVNMKVVSGGGNSKAYMESVNFYKDSRFERIAGLAERSPLVDLKVFAKKIGSNEFYTEEFAKFKDHSFSDIKGLLISLGSQGFLDYNIDEDKVRLRDKLFFYIGAKFSSTDYDVIRFESQVQGFGNSNARLNLGNLDMRLDGVDRVLLSDSQNVYVVPSNQKIILKKNRNFAFGGRVYAGRFQFFGKEFDFDYDKFKINLYNVDSLRFLVPYDSAKTEREQLILVKSVVEHVTGDVLIDNAKNRSSKVYISQYPIFNSIKDSYVYYDRPSIQGGVYKRDNFYFHLNPFSVDSLENFTKEGLFFSGELKSADIFPIFNDTLRMRPDYSLGFIRQTPAEGFPMYKGKGNYKATIDLSNRGLIGSGELSYLTSIAQSNLFKFYPDSTNGIAEGYEVKKDSYGGTAFPHAFAKNVKIHWEPYKNQLFATQLSEPFDMYDGKGSMVGTIIDRPTGLDGDGTLSFYESELTSNQFRFKQMKFNADTADFRMKAELSNTLVFKSNNVNAKVDFETEIGDFKSNSPDDYITFPVNQYICYLDKFKWLMGKKLIELGGGDMPNPKGYEYVSIKSGQDSLRFLSPKATFDIAKLLLHAKQVSEIYVADAAISPDSGDVYVEKDAHMRTLERAKILANVYTRYHNIENATVDILGRKRYLGVGDYIYTNKQKIKQNIRFTTIKVDSMETVANGEVTEKDGFTLSPQFSYKGTAHLKASRKYLKFEGYTQMNTKCTTLDRSWAKFNSDINPDSIYIPVDKFVNDKGEEIAAGFGVGSEGEGNDLKGMFLSRSVGAKRDHFISSGGFLTYNKPTNEFRISTKAKLGDLDLNDDYMSFNDTKCVLYGEGKVTLSQDWGRFKYNSIGNITQKQNSGESVLDAYIAMDFYFNSEAMDALVQAVQNSGMEYIDPENPSFIKNMNVVLGKEKAEEYLSGMALYGQAPRMPKVLEHSLMFTNLQMKWDPFNRSFRSQGRINVGSINKVQMNFQMKGVVEIIKRNRGDEINIYLESDDLGWWFFNYEGGVLQSISEDEVFNDALKNVDTKKATLKAEKGLPSYEYYFSTPKKKDEFLRRMGYRK